MAKIVRFSETIMVQEETTGGLVVNTRTVIFVERVAATTQGHCPFDIYKAIFEGHNDFITQVRRFILEKANHSATLFIEEEKDDEFWSDDDPSVKK